MRLWFYNRAEDTDAKYKAIQALQYMVSQWLGTEEQNTATQPKITDFAAEWTNSLEEPSVNTELNMATTDNLNVSGMQKIDVTNGIW
jgi:hypothetical protein